MSIEKVFKALRVVKVFSYRRHNISWAIQGGSFVVLWNPLTWIVLALILPIALICDGVRGLRHIPKAISTDRQERAAYTLAKQKGWLIDG